LRSLDAYDLEVEAASCRSLGAVSPSAEPRRRRDGAEGRAGRQRRLLRVGPMTRWSAGTTVPDWY